MKPAVNVLVVGSSGFLGKAVMENLNKRKNVVTHATHRSRPTFTGSIPFDFWHDEVTSLLERTRADVVVFTAAVEADAPTAQLEARATRFFRACSTRRVVYLSSDALFDGMKGNYTESDSPSPVTQYGRNLRMLESLIRNFCQDACIIRPSYLYGYSLGELDHRLSSVHQQLLSGEAAYYAEDMFKSLMEVTLAARAVVGLALSSYTGIVHISGERTSVYAFYRDAITLLGLPAEKLYKNRLFDATVSKDTSLDATLMTKLTRVPVLGVQEALAKSRVSSASEPATAKSS